MSHITELKADIEFKDESVLREVLGTMGKVLEGTRAKTVILNTGTIKELSFLYSGDQWKARADNWGKEEEYKTLITKIQTAYQVSAINRVMQKNRYLTTQKASNIIIGRRF